jgi:8-hydroxy-5-deazaflavin:NADPH oxidoreductase
MEIGIIGAGHIGGNAARRFALSGHSVLLSYSRDPSTLDALAREIGKRARAGTPADAAACPVVVLSVPWRMIDDALAQAGSLTGRIVIDTTNQYGPGGLVTFPGGATAAQYNAARMPRARYTKTFNTLTAGFQAAVASRTSTDRVVQWVAGDDAEATATVLQLVRDAGYAPVDLGGTSDCAVMEAPRRPGAVYGEEWRLPDALTVVDAVRAGHPIPPTPHY